MARTCTVCTHELSHDINVALVRREGSFRTIANRYGLSQSALKRHLKEHIPKLLVEASEAITRADADDLLARVESLHARTLAILEAAEGTGELRTALGAIREARGNLELLAKLLGELEERPQVNILIAPVVREAIVAALRPYGEARLAVVNALEPFEDAS